MNLYLSISAVFPLLCYLIIGFLCTKFKILDKQATSKFNDLLFQILFPLNLFKNVIDAREALLNGEGSSTIVYLIIISVVFLVLLVFGSRLLSKDPKRRGAFIIGVFSNNVLLFSLIIAETLLGPKELGTISIGAVVITALINIISSAVLEYLNGEKPNFIKLLISLFKNNNIIGSLVGFIFVMLDIRVPELLMLPIRNVSAAILPISLIILGADLNLNSTITNAKDLAIASVLKLVVCPAIAIYLAYFIGFRGNDIITIFALSSAPTAVVCYTYTLQLNSDAPFCGELITVSTMLSIVSIFLWILVLPI